MTLATSRLASLRGGWVPFVLYPLLALVSFPTIELLLWGRDGLLYAHDLLDIPRSGIFDDWLTYGPSLWNAHVASGNALLAQQAIGPFAIDVPLGFLLGSFGALLVNGWLLAAAAGIAMHLFLRDCLRLSTAAVLAGAVIFAFGFWHPIIGFAIPLTPLLLWLGERAMKGSPVRWRYAVAHVVLGAFILYNGQSQIVVLVAVLELAYLWFGAGFRGVRTVSAWALLWAGTFGLYAPVLMTQLPLLPESQRSSWLLERGPIGSILAAAARMYSTVVIGVPVGNEWGRSPSIYGTFYLGLAGLPLLVAAVLSRPRGRSGFLLVVLLAIPLLDMLLTLAGPLQAQLGPLRSFQVSPGPPPVRLPAGCRGRRWPRRTPGDGGYGPWTTGAGRRCAARPRRDRVQPRGAGAPSPSPPPPATRGCRLAAGGRVWGGGDRHWHWRHPVAEPCTGLEASAAAPRCRPAPARQRADGLCLRRAPPRWLARVLARGARSDTRSAVHPRPSHSVDGQGPCLRRGCEPHGSQWTPAGRRLSDDLPGRLPTALRRDDPPDARREPCASHLLRPLGEPRDRFWTEGGPRARRAARRAVALCTQPSATHLQRRAIPGPSLDAHGSGRRRALPGRGRDRLRGALRRAARVPGRSREGRPRRRRGSGGDGQRTAC